MPNLELRCDHFIRATPDIATAHQELTRLGLRATPPGPAADTGAQNTVVALGTWPESMMFVEHMTHPDRTQAAADPRTADLVPLLDAGGGMRQLLFAIDDLGPARAVFADQPGGFHETVVTVADGDHEVRRITPADSSPAGCRFTIAQYPDQMGELLAAAAIPTGHDFPVKRVDHMAIIPPDFEAGTRYWTEVMGLPVVGEIDAPGFLIRQVRAGDVMIELLKSSTSEGPLAQAPPGLLPVLACEVDDLAGVRNARSTTRLQSN